LSLPHTTQALQQGKNKPQLGWTSPTKGGHSKEGPHQQEETTARLQQQRRAAAQERSALTLRSKVKNKVDEMRGGVLIYS
jgi:hypothetical protein